MSEVVKLKITKAGLYSMFNARASGIKLELKTMKYSSDNFESKIMDERTSLNNIVSESSIVASGTSASTNTIRFITVINSNSELHIGAVGVYTAEGVLFAIASVTNGSLFKVYSGISFTATFGLAISPQVLGSISVVVDQNTPIVYSMINDHEIHENPHPQYAKASELLEKLNSIKKEIEAITQGQGALGGQMIGVGDDYVEVTRKTDGTVYINNTNKPIMVFMDLYLTDNYDPMQLVVHGKRLGDLEGYMYSGTIYTRIPCSFIVGLWKSYSITKGEIKKCHELRTVN
ncbi:phage tail-collar fiber domain-containing protein [Acinetobacter bereziniae]|uniref:phage tail-collar fiber domain-containing protein n=1 Tax=Acinetobacter bereziniae TaxID=106648 RepID=UPI00125078E4|nr:hypothetical protein [Acinetobacter bereziniae]